jgi:putative acetyltransferase
MIRKINEEEYPRLLEIWISAVENTHDFLKNEDFEFYKENVPTYFQYVNLVGYYTTDNILVGFAGVADHNLEMLFIHNDYRGKGIGKELLNYTIENLEVSKVDVNEQNKQAVDFYLYLGFKVINRSEKDGEGKEYPILHLSR